MDRLRWVGIAFAALIAGFFGQKLTGNWIGLAIGGVGVGLMLTLLFAEQWIAAVMVLMAGCYLLFISIVDAPAPPEAKLAPKAAQAGQAGGERVALLPPDGLKAGAKLGVADPAAPEPEPAASAAGGSLSKAPKEPLKTVKDCADCPELVAIAPGQFIMGSDTKTVATAGPASPSPAVDPREGPSHAVAVAGFFGARFATTKAEFAAFVKATQYKTEAEQGGGCVVWANGSWGNKASANWRQSGIAQADTHPVVCVSWNDAQAYAQWLSQVTGHSYRLLSESEREYATRAGTYSTFWWGEELSPERANYDTTAPDFLGSKKGPWRRSTVPVNSFEANAFGMYNMHGNVWEWVEDCQHNSYSGAPANGSAWTAKCDADARVVRGGAWVGDPAGLRSSSRGWFSPDFRFQAGGFRVARALAVTK